MGELNIENTAPAEIASMAVDNSSDDLDWDTVEDVADFDDSSDTTAEVEDNTTDEGINNMESGDASDILDEVKEIEDIDESETTDNEVENNSETEETEAETKEEVKSDSVDLNSLDDESKITVKIDGELQEVSIKDFKNGISGEKAIAKRFTEYDKKEKEFNTQIDQINNFISELGTTMKDKSMVEGLYEIGKLNNLAPHQIKAKLIEEMLPEIIRLEQMSEEERQLEFQKSELDYTKQQQESEMNRLKTEQANKELQLKVDAVRETHAINDEEWNNAVNYLDENLPKHETITADLVGEYVQYNRADTLANDSLKSFQEGAYSNDRETLNKLRGILIENPDFNNEDVQSILDQAFGSAKKDEAEKKVTKVIEKKTKVSPTQEKLTNEPLKLQDSAGNEADDWEDIL